ncbi:cobalamin biosynthesis protein [Pseudohoeflea suaedae]|uniref:Cobalamin biosynthesis protein CobD n=1 Tax=Pseudohoeflea suaedae TaxID=877384 RepID=A0A4R5PJG5_9HYPH|nr:adenosylcobinamide-phosphate synthase CbiB [Pseudohoeflea suaedae]TDH35811.1 cobalamin biosynthesis protein [Pseudohoeflea suaedae]
MIRLGILFLALLIDRLVGDPDWLWRRMAHPVVLIGAMIGFADRSFNEPAVPAATRRRRGLVAIAGLVAISVAAGWLLSDLFGLFGWAGLAIEAIVVSIFLAQKSLFDHVVAVAEGLRTGGIEGGRRAVSMIVGRDPEALDSSDVCRAAIESLAENFSDGVVAPALWYLIGGLPGLLAYKTVNTADSMIGHLNATYRDFGRASAKLDDVMNWPAARLSALILVAGTWLAEGYDAARNAAGVALQDAGLHRSPNAGWPEAAVAGALGLALGGPRRYGDLAVSAACLNGAGTRRAGPDMIEKAVRIGLRSTEIQLVAVFLLMLALASF